MKYILITLFLFSLVLLMGEGDNLLNIVIVKGIALLVMLICGKLLPRYMTDGELNEEV